MSATFEAPVVRDLQRSSSVSVDRGLYVLRYVSSETADEAPMATVRAAAGSESLLRFIDAPGVPEGFLAAPGASLVVVSAAYAKVEITVKASAQSKVLDAKFALELLAKGSEAAVAARPVGVAAEVGPAMEAPAAAPLRGPATIEILAHVSRRGDVIVAPGEWVAGPDAPTPIEGVQIRCAGADLAVSAQFVNTTQPGVWSSWWSAGDFVGSRQQASPLTGLRLKLVGRDASRFELEADAMFLGLPLQRHSGSEVTLATATGLDLLVGLKLGLRPASRQEMQTASKPPRVRVFRSDKADLVNS